MAALFENMAFRGDWKPLFEFIADAIREQSRIREYIVGEAHIKGFLLAYLLRDVPLLSTLSGIRTE